MTGRTERRLFPYAVLLLAAAAVFFPGISDGHLSGDDVLYTCGCPFVRDGFSVSNLWSALTDFGYGAIWMPLTFVSYMLDFSFGGSWFAHHAVNVALHAANACLCFAFLRMLFGRLCGTKASGTDVACLLAALVWAVHPMRADAVTWIASRKEELWTLFALGGLMAWMRRLETGRFCWTAVTFACFALSCLSKPTAVCFPLLAAALGGVLMGRKGLPWRALLTMLLVSVAVGLVAVRSQSHPTGVGSAVDVMGENWSWRLLNAAVSLGLTVGHAVWPVGVHHEYRAVFGGWPVNGLQGLFALAVSVLLVAVVMIRCDGRVRRVTLLSVLWLLAGLGPTLGVVGFVNGDQAMADRYAYLPSLAFSFVVAHLLLACGGVRMRRLGVGLVLAAVGAEAVLTVPVVRSLHDDYSAYARSLACDPEHWRALRVVGNEYCARMNRMDEGVSLLRKSLRIRASQRTADSLAYVLAHRGKPGDFAEVKRLGRAAASDSRLDPGGMMLDALGVVSFGEGDYERAVRYFRLSLAAPRREYDSRHTRGNLERVRRAMGL